MRLLDAWRSSGLKGRVLALVLATMVAIALPASGIFLWIVNGTVVKLGTLFAEKQILFDRFRGLEALMREVSLAETVARAPVIVEWAQDERDPEKARRGLAELEHYRLSFNDRSYFAVVDKSGNYYFNDKDNSYEHNRLRYAVSPDAPQDAWYFKTRALGKGCHLNVNRDETLGVTKVWINCIIQKDGQVLGLIGTGVDLTQFIREVVEFPQTGVQSMFVDLQGAIQAHRDPRVVDFHSLTKDISAKKTIFNLLDRETDRVALAEMMKQVSRGDVLVLSRFMQMEGREVLVGVGFLDRLGWFNVTVMDVDAIIDRKLFMPLAALIAAILLAAATLMALLFKRKVLDRLAWVEQGLARLRGGDFKATAREDGHDEIARLAHAFNEMAQAVGDNTGRLEAMVRERTEQLERLAQYDPLTSILNRRGFDHAFAREQNRARREGKPCGLLIVDLDRFKRVNDEHGHQGGDAVLVACVQRMSSVLRNYDACARWGGDEFILLISGCDVPALSAIAAKLGANLRDAPVPLGDGRMVAVTASIGAVLVGQDESLSDAAARADAALYEAKRNGRDRFVLHKTPLRAA
ncbi:diguanylate cyclase [Bosea sp. (in: a-proteobacteria)]|uniref:sensor domain-containing diguanylate cyclase n=1 Tax=Bosea sp. (in: a-proteobacteria) TaxID=1871050 RepID=UPI001AD246C8|nr:diguanylate cyclase [Bosea sp. (in: a-proteobacteria)]MBN9440199.1 GGDEF domain-containing protein [Bosea sp. (in: a-proteobacteria)]